jgi:hypothetical protein
VLKEEGEEGRQRIGSRTTEYEMEVVDSEPSYEGIWYLIIFEPLS